MRKQTLIVLDTNVLVSGLLKRSSPPGQILDLILSGAIQIIVDERILEEYRLVLVRPRLNIPSLEAQQILLLLSATSIHVSAHPLDLKHEDFPDPKDLPFAEVAIAGNVQALVTGNSKHFFYLKNFGVEVLSPAEFMEHHNTK